MVLSFSVLSSAPCVGDLQFDHSPAEGHWGFFQCLLTVNKAMNFHYRFCVNLSSHFSRMNAEPVFLTVNSGVFLLPTS